MASLQHEMTYRIRVRGPAKATTGSPQGERQYWEMSDGELGTEDQGSVTDDGETVLLRYQGLVQLTEAFKQAAGNDASTRFEDQYMRMAMFFDTGAARYAWLNQSLFIAEGRLAGPKEVEYRIYRVT